MTESEGFGFHSYMKTPSRFLFDIDDKHITRIGEINDEIMFEHSYQIKINKPSVAQVLPIGTNVKHKVFGEGVIEEADELTKTYIIRFLIGTKPIRFDYQGLSQVF